MPAALPLSTSHLVFPQKGDLVNMGSRIYCKIILLALALLLIDCGLVADAAAASPGRAMSAHLWINGLPQGQLVSVTVADHSQHNYYGGQGRYDFPIAGKPDEIIRVLADGKEVQSFAFESGAVVYLNLTYADGTVTASPYDPGVPMPTPYPLPTIAPEPETEHTGISLDGTWIFVMAAMLSLVIVGCFATVRRKGR
jgi:hypothetical protein